MTRRSAFPALAIGGEGSEKEGWTEFIAKPEHGQDGRDQKFFTPPAGKDTRFQSIV